MYQFRALLTATGDLLPGTRRLLQLPLISLVHQPAQFQLSTSSSCPNPQLSCPLQTPSPLDTCCVNHPSGHFLQTQFWDASPPTGPNNSWTIHGLWPDYCTGGFEQFCDQTRSYDNISAILQSAGASDLVDFMSTHWLALDRDDKRLWSHEWNKHGTCISTLERSCYDSQSDQFADVVDYFTNTINLYRTLDTFSTLAAADIMPSSSKTWTLAELEKPLQERHGFPVTLRCNYRHELDEIWYHFSVRGSLRNAAALAFTINSVFIPTQPDGQISNCPHSGIKYLPKTARQPAPSTLPSSTSSTSPTATSSPTKPFTGRGHLKVYIKSDTSSPTSTLSRPPPQPQQTLSEGCLIRAGTWYTSGSCGLYRAQADIIDPAHQTLFTLSSSYAPCAVLSNADNQKKNQLTCDKNLGVQTIFSSAEGLAGYLGNENDDGADVLAYQNRTRFYAAKVPGRFEKVDLFADDGDGARPVVLEIRWVGVD